MVYIVRLRNFLILVLLFGGVFGLALIQGINLPPDSAVLTNTTQRELRIPYLTQYGGGLSVTADSALLMDARTGTVLWAKNEHKQRPPASTTKILTAVVALEYGNLSETITIDRSATGVGGSQIWLEPGEKRTLQELIQGLMLKSGNDAAVAIAQHIGGSVEGFSTLLNKRARELGAFNTVFSNPNGLPEKTKPHYSTAYDLALMARRGLQIPIFQTIVQTKYDQIPWGNHDWERRLTNTNKLLWYFPGADGVKTGTTTAAGNCLVASATREGFQLIAVVLHADNRWGDAAKILEYGFKNFQPMLIGPEGTALKKVSVRNGVRDQVELVPAKEIAVVVPVAQWNQIQTRLIVPEYLIAPFWSGEMVGKVEVLLDGQVLASEALLTAEPIRRQTWWWLRKGA